MHDQSGHREYGIHGPISARSYSCSILNPQPPKLVFAYLTPYMQAMWNNYKWIWQIWNKMVSLKLTLGYKKQLVKCFKPHKQFEDKRRLRFMHSWHIKKTEQQTQFCQWEWQTYKHRSITIVVHQFNGLPHAEHDWCNQTAYLELFHIHWSKSHG